MRIRIQEIHAQVGTVRSYTYVYMYVHLSEHTFLYIFVYVLFSLILFLTFCFFAFSVFSFRFGHFLSLVAFLSLFRFHAKNQQNRFLSFKATQFLGFCRFKATLTAHPRPRIRIRN